MPSVRARSSYIRSESLPGGSDRSRRRVAYRLQTRQTRGGPWGVRGGFGQNLAGTRRSSRKAPSPTEGHRRGISSRHGILCEERTGGGEEASHFIIAEKPRGCRSRDQIMCTCGRWVPDAAQSGEGDLRPPRPGRRRGHQRRRSSIRRVRTWHVVRAPRADPARIMWSLRTLAGGTIWSSVEQYGEWWRMVEQF